MTDTDVNYIVTRTRTRAPTLLITITIIALRKRKRLPREEGASDYVDIELIYRHLEKVFSTSLMNKRDIKKNRG